MSAPDYSDLFGSTELSDITIVLAEHAEHLPLRDVLDRFSSSLKIQQVAGGTARTPRAAVWPHGSSCSNSCCWCHSSSIIIIIISSSSESPQKKEMPGHGIVLYGCSSFCKAKLLNWKGNQGNAKLEICIPVPTGQLAVGELLVRGMYAAQPDVSSCSQEQLLHLLLLADSYGVPKVLAAAAAAFSRIASADLQWQTLHALYALPPGCAELDICKPLFAAAGQKLQQELGDLELVWTDAGKQQLLLALPQPVLLQLLQDPLTRVASENTVFYTIDRWCRQQQQQQQALDTSAVHELLKLVRMQHCTPLFVVTTLAHSELAQQHFTPEELATASALATAAHSGQKQLVQALVDKSPTLAKYPAWSAKRRPASVMQQLELQWEMPMQELKQAFERVLIGSFSAQSVFGTENTWQGDQFLLKVELKKSCDGQPGVSLGGFLCSNTGAVRRVTYSVVAQKARGGGSLGVQGSTQTFSGRRSGWGQVSMAQLGQVTSWAAVEAKLRQLDLVHSDGCLHLQGRVTNII